MEDVAASSVLQPAMQGGNGKLPMHDRIVPITHPILSMDTVNAGVCDNATFAVYLQAIASHSSIIKADQCRFMTMKLIACDDSSQQWRSRQFSSVFIINAALSA